MPAARWKWIVMMLLLAAVSRQESSAVAQPSRVDVGWMDDFERAEAEAKRLERPLLIHFHASWCVPCRRMDRDVLSSPELAAQLKQSFVGVKVDADQNPEVLRRFGVRSLPADLVVSPEGRVLIQTRGYQDKQNYIARLDSLGQRLRPEPSRPLPSENPQQDLLAKTQTNKPPELAPLNPLPGLDGFSPVSLHTWREWRKGKPEFTAYHKGVAYQMVSKAELDEFVADPDQFVPRLLGCDPVILLQTDRAVPGSTKYGAYYDGKLYLFQTPETRAEFRKSPLRYIKTRHVLNADEIERGDIRQSAKPPAPSDPITQ